jgi:hypothetical protein
MDDNIKADVMETGWENWMWIDATRVLIGSTSAQWFGCQVSSLPTNESWRKVLKYCKTASFPLTAIHLRMSMDMKFYIDIGGSSEKN